MPNIELHNELNPKLWDKDELDPKVRYALMKIALEFYKFLEVDVEIVDVIISGSQANYNYTSKSDVDVHLIVPFDRIGCDLPVDEFFDTKRRLWKEYHDNIKVNGLPVELYVEDLDDPAVSSTYSLIKNTWIDHPEPPPSSINQEGVVNAYASWSKVVKNAIKSNDLKLCRKVKEYVQHYRKAGLAKGGEYSVPNLVYKELRNAGLISKLMDTINNLYDKSLSI